MPPWNQMSPQQQAMFLQMMHTQFGGGALPNFSQPGVNPAIGAQQMAAPGMAQMGINPNTAALTNQLASPQMGQMNPQMLQYLMGLQGQAAAPPNLAQFLSGQQPPPAYTQYPGF